MFQTLLVDPVPMVRVAAVTGVCKVMSIYWEMISATIIKSLISKVILELVWDASSADVRESVIKVRGLIKIIQSLISKVILELVCDASSADVRERVIKVGVKPALKDTSI